MLEPICAFDTVPVKSPPTAADATSTVRKVTLPEPSVVNTCPSDPSDVFNSVIPIKFTKLTLLKSFLASSCPPAVVPS